MALRSAWRRAQLAAVAGVLGLLSACAGAAQPTVVTITSPTMNAEVPVGVELPIQGSVTGENIVRVEVLIDGMQMALLTVRDPSQGVSYFPIQAVWTPSLAGTHIVQLNVYGPNDQLLTTSDPIIFMARADLIPPTPTPAAAPPMPTDTPLPPPTFTPVPTQQLPASQTAQPPAEAATPTSTAAPISLAVVPSPTAASAAQSPAGALEPVLTVTVDILNVRAGPGTNYPLIGQLLLGATARVTGRSADGQWWQIRSPAGAGGVGWVFAELVQVNEPARSVAIAIAPPTPTPAPTVAATVHPVPTPATSTPVYGGPACTSASPSWRGANPNYPFCADQDVTWGDPAGDWAIYPNGKSIPLSISWNVYGPNIDEIWLRFDSADGVCPFNRPARAPISLQFPQGAASFRFNAGEYPNGATFRVFLLIKLKDGRWVQFGEKRLCIE
ncbi:MAG: SH3 domain-containing protein [Anaerolineae bacterium]|nr:SH3 domain-containing protein [Thermoflexales bacterium]MDW8407092.1 SH3 domain-containing protein [Anaerolineae bacterium]